MPITQDRILALTTTARLMATENDKLRDIVKRASQNAPDGTVIKIVEHDFTMTPKTDQRALVIEEYHFHKFGKRNKKEALRQQWKRRERGTMTRESAPNRFIPIDPKLGERTSPERIRELAKIEREAELEAAAIDNPDEFANETEEEMLVRFQQDGMTEKEAKSSIQALKDEGIL